MIEKTTRRDAVIGGEAPVRSPAPSAPREALRLSKNIAMSPPGSLGRPPRR